MPTQTATDAVMRKRHASDDEGQLRAARDDRSGGPVWSWACAQRRDRGAAARAGAFSGSAPDHAAAGGPAQEPARPAGRAYAGAPARTDHDAGCDPRAGGQGRADGPPAASRVTP